MNENDDTIEQDHGYCVYCGEPTETTDDEYCSDECAMLADGDDEADQ